MLLRKAFARTKILPEEVAIAVAWAFLVGGLFWWGVYLTGSRFLGFGEPGNWLAAVHFVFAGFGALTVTAFCCRAVSHARALLALRLLLAGHPIAYLTTAAGIYGVRHADEIGASLYEILFVVQLGAVLLGGPDRIPRGPRTLLVAALVIPVVTIIPAMTWAWGSPMFDLSEMVRYHGIVNAVGHVGLGLCAFAWGHPVAHAPMRSGAD